MSFINILNHTFNNEPQEKTLLQRVGDRLHKPATPPSKTHDMSGQGFPLNATIDPYQFLHIIPTPDGMIRRNPNRYPNTSPTPDPSSPTTQVLSKDIHINQSNKTWARIFLPRKNLNSSLSTKKLPLIVYYHGGGFINCSAASTIYHEFCSNIVMQVPAVIVSVEYRLAPEHRLPAAYDDAVEALHWIKANNEVWVSEYADFTNCFIMGSSSGANIAYHACLRLSQEVGNLEPLKIKGLILHHPFISGTQRTKSELRMVNGPYLPQSASDLMWELSLPIAVDLDHEYCNPMVDGGSKLLENVRLLGWRVLVTGCNGDPLIDRQIELVNMMVGKEVMVVKDFSEGGYHIVEIRDPSKAKPLLVVLKDFMLSSEAA